MSATAPTATLTLPRVLVLASRRAVADDVGRTLQGVTAEVHLAESVVHATELLLDNEYDALVLYPDSGDTSLGRFARRLERLRVHPATLVLGATGSGDGLAEALRDAVFVSRSVDGFALRAELDRLLRPRAGDSDVSRDEGWHLALVGHSEGVDVLREQVRALSRWPSVSVLLLGEPGTGKSDVARALHEATGARGALAVLSAADSSPADVDAALRKLGAADGRVSTLYIEGVEGLSEDAQHLLAERLRVRGGSGGGDVGRLVTGSARRLDLAALLGDSLYSVIAEFPLRLPPLRERLRDIPELVRAIVAGHGNGSAREHLAPGTIEQLQRLPWTTNLEQLVAVVEGARSIAADGVIGHVEIVRAWEHLTGEQLPVTARVGDPHPVLPADGSPPRTLRQIEHDAITSAFSAARGNVTMAAKRLGIPRSTLRDRLRRLGMR